MLPDPPKSRNGPKPAPPIFDIASLPLGTQAHATDTYSLVAIITPFKLLVVALKPTPRTLWRVLNKPDTAVENTKPSVGSLAWWPASGDTAPVLAFSWGQEIRLVMVEDDDDLEAEPATKEKDGRKRGLRFKERARWSIPDVGLATLWLSAKVRNLLRFSHYVRVVDEPRTDHHSHLRHLHPALGRSFTSSGRRSITGLEIPHQS